MRTEIREFCGSISVRIDTQRHKLELSSAENYGGPKGLYRVRIARRWIDGPDGKPLFFNRSGLATLLASQAFGEQVSAQPDRAPDLPKGTPVMVKFWVEDIPHCEGTRTSTPPWRGFDGRWWVWAVTYEAGMIAVPVEDVVVKRERTRRDAVHEGAV